MGRLARDVATHRAPRDRGARHIRHQPPFDLHDRHPRVGREETHVGAERELETAAKSHALDRGDDRYRQLPPAPHRLLREVGEPMRAPGQVAAFTAWYTIAPALLHGGEAAHIEAGAERASLTRQHHGS